MAAVSALFLKAAVVVSAPASPLGIAPERLGHLSQDGSLSLESSSYRMNPISQAAELGREHKIVLPGLKNGHFYLLLSGTAKQRVRKDFVRLLHWFWH
ncbi:hypothetical protein KIN20_009798 [Parelaphostrongylus tenuis]|uniref:Uncharacterized protein n=1 Tax=Parelaphostrongylus tenuis TaxID=148309 RepID=A0AAD5MSC4_PARTN|nr:hypothetical protein KIN20_009798 [Parelaphostrongylus tenuis]